MVDIPVNELHSMSVGQLERCIQRMNEELSRRHQEERIKAIDTFKEAFDHLYGLGIVPVYSTYEDDGCLVETYLEDPDNFTFNY